MPRQCDYRVTDIVNQPGVYMFRDRFRNVIYVGKAKSLRKRLSNYFRPSRMTSADPKFRSLINSIEHFETIPVRTEEEAMLLESRLIKQYAPRYNVVLRDDKRFLLIKIDLNAPYPRLALARLKKDDGCTYFGPFPQAGVLRDTIDHLTRFFGLRSCRPRVPDEKDRKHCLDQIVRYCTAPCINNISREDYHLQVRKLIDVVEGKTDEVIGSLTEKMTKMAAGHRFESAARLRDVVDNITTVFGARNRTFVHTHVAIHPGEEAVNQLQSVLNLPRPPRVMECFDISNISGRFAVAAMVCFRNGAPSRKDYRHYRIRDVTGIDDFAMMTEAISRRYKRLLAEDRPLPDLLVVDGGLGQLHAAEAVLRALACEDLPLIGLAKRNEEIFCRGTSVPIILERHEKSLRLVQAIRDEAHRFANTFHRKLRSARIQNSILDEIPGIGKKRKTQILNRFGSVRNLRRCTAAEIAEAIPGIGDALAGEIENRLRK